MKPHALILLLCVAGGFPRGDAAEAGRPGAGAGAGHWAFRPVVDPAPPDVSDPAWCRTPIDRFVLRRLESEGTRPEPPADRRTLIRRASYGLTGLPPTAEQVEAFEADASPRAWERLVDRLLESPRYGEHWGRHWLDVVRYADTAGETADYPVPTAWRYRNYVIDAFNADKPYDEFVREQIAGDLLAREGPRERYAERVTATGFLAISRRFGFDSENYHHLTLQDTIDTLGQSVLGLTLGCARCHAHKYDPVSMPDYYALYGIFESTRYAFPGSEQKQRTRALVPLLPPEEARPAWREFEGRVATLAARVESGKLPVPGGVLRSLDDLDGDFELQAPAAGGSKGVLVPPWVYDGPIAVTADAQSPFHNLYPLGKVGASVAAGTGHYRIAQALHARRSRTQGGRLYVNLDTRISTNAPADARAHRFWIGSASGDPAVEVFLSASRVALRTGNRVETLPAPAPGAWRNLQLTLDFEAGTVSGTLGRPGETASFAPRPLSPDWSGVVDFVAVEADGATGHPLPDLALDHLGVEAGPIPPVSRMAPAVALAGLADVARGPSPEEEWKRLAGMDGDFELQSDRTPPALPWGPGPKSAVLIEAAAQSPFHDRRPPGRLGVRLPGGEAYQGFGQTLPQRWTVEGTRTLNAGFEFRCGAGEPGGGTGSWRYYLGHGPGTSAAVELFLHGREFFRRSGDARESVAGLVPGEWYQVRLSLDLRERRYSGALLGPSGRTEFSGQFAPAWDGTVDYTFIDSYGHLAGARPVLDADNFVLSDSPEQAPETVGMVAARRARAAVLREDMDRRRREAEEARKELERLLVAGPFPMAYGVSEGTPADARLQRRGEPDQPGEVVPRGFLPVLGGGPLAGGTGGSGRLELAQWLTRPSHPLTARVLVNRVWQYHFGQGLVRTPNDFGTRGQPPTDPELLDYLASEFVAGGWSIKALHRLILASAVYQQRSRLTGAVEAASDAADGAEVGASAGAGTGTPSSSRAALPDDCPALATVTLPVRAGGKVSDTGRQPAEHGHGHGGGADGFAPFPRRRLGAEETRDAILFVTGELDAVPGEGHPFPLPTTWGYTQHGPFGAVYEHRKRSVYLMTQRIQRHPFLALFDGPDPNASTPERRTTVVPTQALFFLNDPFVHACAGSLARRVLAGTDGVAPRLELLFRRVLGRRPDATELGEAAGFLEAYRSESTAAGAAEPEWEAHAALTRVLLGSNEFLTVD